MLRLGTVFTGIGAIEQALIRLGIEHTIVFGCDNGDTTLKLLDKTSQKRRDELAKKNSADLNEYEKAELDKYVEEENRKIDEIRAHVRGLTSPKKKRKYVEDIYKRSCRQHNYVKDSYMANYNIDNKDFHTDIRFFDGRDYQGHVDLLVGGSPCQSFSTVGAQLGFEDTRGTLFHEFARVVNEVRPKVFIFENVNGLTTNDGGRTLATIKHIFRDELHYRVGDEQVLNASDYGIPQTRRRMFIIGIRDDIQCKAFEYPKPVRLKYTLQDFLEDNCADGQFTYDNHTGELNVAKVAGKPNPKFNLTPGVQRYVLASGTKTFKTSTETDLPIARTLLKTMTQHHRAGIDNYITIQENPKKLRALTDRECLRLMGYPDSFKMVVSSAQIYRQAGNSIVVDVMMAIVRQIIATGALGKVKTHQTTIAMDNLKWIDAFSVNFADSAARQELKVVQQRVHTNGTPANKGIGEKRIYVGSDEACYDSFFQFDRKPKFFFQKKDLEEYYAEAQEELDNPSHIYGNDEQTTRRIFDEYASRLDSLTDKWLFFSFKKTFDRQNRYYLVLSSAKIDKANYNYFRDIALPKVTKLMFVKYEDELSGDLYILCKAGNTSRRQIVAPLWRHGRRQIGIAETAAGKKVISRRTGKIP